jgi:hypothetical protein
MDKPTPKQSPGRPRKGPPKVRAFTRPKQLEATVKIEIKLSAPHAAKLRRFAVSKKSTVSAEVRAWVESLPDVKAMQADLPAK